LDQSNGDWEDIARGRCDLSACLFVSDTGDNEERRDITSSLRLAEPEGEQSVDAERYQMVIIEGRRSDHP
jgi:hypothetical protein